MPDLTIEEYDAPDPWIIFWYYVVSLIDGKKSRRLMSNCSLPFLYFWTKIVRYKFECHRTERGGIGY